MYLLYKVNGENEVCIGEDGKAVNHYTAISNVIYANIRDIVPITREQLGVYSRNFMIVKVKEKETNDKYLYAVKIADGR